jgi:spore maturation protein CgeB
VRILYFTHSLTSCWNHGNAHFLRGVLRDLSRRGHDVIAYEPRNSWSLSNLLADHGESGLAAYRAAYPDLHTVAYNPGLDLNSALDGADLVIVHEWNEPSLVAAVGRARSIGGRFTLLFHDTHHRAVSDSKAMSAFDLSAYDGVLAFGEALAEVYRAWGWGRRVFVWHEAADVTHFHPPPEEKRRDGAVWIGNWGDGERASELERFLLAPAQASKTSLDIYGVRYPPEALTLLAKHGARFHGWLPNAGAPEIFSRSLATVHVPRRYYVNALPGIPTIRVFEALACGIPLLSAPWSDEEELFRVGQDFLMARDGDEMCAHMRAIRGDPALRADLARNGLETIHARHTCAHRAAELLAFVHAISPARLEAAG